jgi:hypothetical protein
MGFNHLTDEEALNLNKLVAGNVVDVDKILNELGLLIDFEMGLYHITNKKKWMIGKLKYGI